MTSSSDRDEYSSRVGTVLPAVCRRRSIAISGQMPDPPATSSSGPPRGDVPHKVPTDRTAQLQLVAGAQLAREVRRHLAVVETLDGQRQPLVGARRRSDRVAALGLVSVISGQAHIHVLTGAMPRPAGDRQHEAAHPRGFVDEVDDLGGPPDQSPL